MRGGAIYFSSSNSKGTVTNCNFTNNKATGTDGFGGAIWFTSKGTVENCNFTNNTASQWGGAVFFLDEGTVTNCNFTDNKATGTDSWGGAILFASTGTVTNCNFVKNIASVGNAIYKYESSTGKLIVNRNIFLNNGVSSVIQDASSAEVNFDYNWFGNTATNYTTNPTVGVTLTNWLFLNATLNDGSTSNPVAVFSTNNLTFKLFLYNSTKQKDNVSEYNDPLYPVNLTISSQNSGVGSDIAKLGEKIVYSPNLVGIDSVSASIEGISYTIPLTVKANPNLSVNPLTATYLDPITLTLQYNDKATGKVNITIKSTNNKYSYSLPNQELKNTIPLASLDIKPETYTVTVKYSGDNNFLNTTASSTLKVNKKEYTTNIQDLTVTPLYLNKPALIEGYLYMNNKGFAKQNITLNISTSNGYKIYKLTTDKNGKFNITIKPDTLGTTTIKATYPGNTTTEYIYKTTTNTITQTVTLNKTSYKYLQTQITEALNNNQNNLTLN